VGPEPGEHLSFKLPISWDRPPTIPSPSGDLRG